jgi:cytochrome P450
MFRPQVFPQAIAGLCLRPSRRVFVGGVGAALAGAAVPAWSHTETRPGQHGGYPSDFKTDYIRNVIRPFLETSIYEGERLTLPMIDLAFGKEAAIPPHLWGMLYDGWEPDMEEEGLSVFIQGLENRGEANARKRIYMSALTPDLYEAHYRPKVQAFLDDLFDPENEGEPMMSRYYDGYWDMYWDLHLGVRGDDIPQEVRDIGDSFNAVIGFWDPRREVVYENYMRVRELRPALREWIDARVQAVLDGDIENPEATFVHYWAVNGGLGPDFRREDVVFECFHNFLAFSQWGNTLYQVMTVLAPDGDPEVREAWRQTMEGDPDTADDGPFTPLDRLVMELFRTISPNSGSLSTLASTQDGVTGTSFVIHPHPETSRDERHWLEPDTFDPERYRGAPTAARIDEEHCEAIGFARCPFSGAGMRVEDGRDVELPSNGFGTVHARIDGEAAALVDDAGYAPFGFGYRRCAGEWLTVDFVKEVLRHAWTEDIRFERLEVAEPERLPVGPVVTIEDDVAFRREA